MEDERQGMFRFGMDEPTREELIDAGRWARFLAIMGFVAIGLIFVLVVYVSISMARLFGTAGTSALVATYFAGAVVYLVFGGLYIYPVYALLKFGSHLKPALLTSDQERFNLSLRYLRNMFKYLGIVSIVALSLLGLFLILIGLEAA